METQELWWVATELSGIYGPFRLKAHAMNFAVRRGREAHAELNSEADHLYIAKYNGVIGEPSEWILLRSGKGNPSLVPWSQEAMHQYAKEEGFE
jgi:hypothetical protein